MNQLDTSWMRNREGLGVWEHRGKVAVAGIGQSYVERRWDGKSMDKTMGAKAINAAQKAMEDAGLTLDDIDGVITSLDTRVGESWAPRPYFAPPYDSEDGLTWVSGEWLIKQTGLKNVKYINSNAPEIGGMMGLAAQAVGDGLCNIALVYYPMGNIEGRYGHGEEAALDYAYGQQAFYIPWGHDGHTLNTVIEFKQYCRKYGSSHEQLAPLAINQRRNGLLTPWGFYTLHDPYQITLNDYLSARVILDPLVLHDFDRPVLTCTAFIITTAERARDMKQPPVYILNHCQNRFGSHRGIISALEEEEEATDSLARKMWEGSRLGPKDVDVFNPFDGYLTLPQQFLEAFQWHGVKRGEAHDFYAGDIRVEGPHPFLSSGGNNGTGRNRTAIHSDSIEQLRGTAGARQIKIRCETALAGGVPGGWGFVMYSKYPN